jgi:hypothetical protein
MSCKSCGSKKVRRFKAEIAILLPGYETLIEPTVFVWPELVVCPACGVAQFAVPERELRLLLKEDTAKGFSDN